jgi:hypothetical protein
VVECLLAKENVESSNLFSRSIFKKTCRLAGLFFRARLVKNAANPPKGRRSRDARVMKCIAEMSQIRLYQSPSMQSFAIEPLLLVGSAFKLVYYRQMFSV